MDFLFFSSAYVGKWPQSTNSVMRACTFGTTETHFYCKQVEAVRDLIVLFLITVMGAKSGADSL